MHDTRRIDRITGRAIPLRGDSIDTDRIVPARFLKAVSFEGLEAHVFEDDRRADPAHPFSNPAYQGASILLVNANFGCGSSREHAPQALERWGIRAVIGESFSEIFAGNALTIGLPCVTVSREAVEQLMELVERSPETIVTVSLVDLTAQAGNTRFAIHLPPATRQAFLEGLWDATGLLLDRYDQVERAAARLPYLRGF